MNNEIKEIHLGDNWFLASLTEKGLVYAGYGPETLVKIAACEGHFGDWAAYYSTPTTPFNDVVAFGNKLPEEVARELFPNWAKRGLRWRL